MYHVIMPDLNYSQNRMIIESTRWLEPMYVKVRMSILFGVTTREAISRDPVNSVLALRMNHEIRGSLQTAQSTPLLCPDEEEGNQADEWFKKPSSPSKNAWGWNGDQLRLISSPGGRRLDPVLASAWRRKDEVVRARASFEHFSDITTDEHHHLPQPSNSSVRHAANRQDRNQRHRLVRLFSRYAPAALLRCSGHAVSCLLNRLNRPAPTSLLRTRCLALFRARI